MSTIYTDGAGNKYLGDCQWANHDINYPAVNWLRPQVYPSTFDATLASISSILNDPSLQYQSVQFNSAAFLSGGDVFSFKFLNASEPTMVWTIQTGSWSEGASFTASQIKYSMNKHGATAYYHNCCFGQQSLLFHLFLNWAPYNGAINYHRKLFCFTKLLNVNPNFNYYTSSINHYVAFTVNDGYLGDSLTSLSQSNHFIVGAAKNLLQTGRAVYSISCSDGQSPSSQWATDMWVYDNNSALGFPVIGRVPNMLLGIGTYTYLKPVKIQGSVFPDNGSPWYLPVGTFSGKVLLMRCYSSVT